MRPRPRDRRKNFSRLGSGEACRNCGIRMVFWLVYGTCCATAIRTCSKPSWPKALKSRRLEAAYPQCWLPPTSRRRVTTTSPACYAAGRRSSGCFTPTSASSLGYRCNLASKSVAYAMREITQCRVSPVSPYNKTKPTRRWSQKRLSMPPAVCRPSRLGYATSGSSCWKTNTTPALSITPAITVFSTGWKRPSAPITPPWAI